MKHEPMFATPRKQLSLSFAEWPKESHLNTPLSINSPQSPAFSRRSSLSLETSYDLLSSPTPPISSPTSPISSPTMQKYLPISSLVDHDEVIAQIDDSVIDQKFHFETNKEKTIGRGSYSTVLETQCQGALFAIKIPTGIKTSKLILKEMFNYRVVQNHALLHVLELQALPVLNVYGLTFIDKSQYPRLRAQESVPCLVSELLSYSLERLISKSVRTEGQLHIGTERWWELARQSLAALELLQQCHIVHMDIKPSNILYNVGMGQFKICDFTSAGLQEDIIVEHGKKLQNGGFFDVTIQYCAPELVLHPPQCPSHHTDLYALGLSLLYAATGEQPYASLFSSGSSMIYITESIKKNKILDFVSHEAMAKLRNDPRALHLIEMIIQRQTLDACLDFVH